MCDKCCVILAAGEGKRMNSEVPKVLVEVLSKPMLGWIVDSVNRSAIKDMCVVCGFKYEMVQEYLKNFYPNCENAVQDERKGTAHALMTAKSFLERHKGGEVLVLGGDSPFIDEKTILSAYKKHRQQVNSATVISSNVENPFGYGRIVRDENKNKVVAIVEENDATADEKAIKEINSGAYWFKVDDLLLHLFDISNDTANGEYYLTSIIKLFLDKRLRVDAFPAACPEIVLGANTPEQLENLNKIAKLKKLGR